jgi:hypothetical protein
MWEIMVANEDAKGGVRQKTGFLSFVEFLS